MGIFAKLRERYTVIKFLVNAQKSVFYPILLAILCFIGATNNYTVYIPIMWSIIAMHLFSVLFADDNKVFIAPLCMIFFAIGIDNDLISFYYSGGNLLAFMHSDALKHLIAMGIIGVGSFLLRLFLDGSIAAALKKRRHFTWGIIAMDAAFLLNGIFSKNYSAANLGYGALLAIGFTVVYFLVSGMLDRSKEPAVYACQVTLCLAYSALLQVITVVYRLNAENRYILYHPGGIPYVNKSWIVLGWGVSTVIAAIFVLGIPAAMYLAKNRRASLISFISCPIFVLGTVIINARTSMFIGIAMFFICTVICCISGKNKVAIRIYSAVSALLVCAAAVYVIPDLPIEKLFSGLRLDSLVDNNRLLLWHDGLSDFTGNPIFGAGFEDGGYSAELKQANFYSNMYHCILVQLPAAMGIVGCLAFLLHAKEFVSLAFKRPSSDRFLILCLPLMIILMSLADNFFFYLQFQIFYGVFCSVAEKGAEQSSAPFSASFLSE